MISLVYSQNAQKRRRQMENMFKNLPIGKKLRNAFIIILGCSILSSLISIVGIFMEKDQLTYFYDTPYKNAVAATISRMNLQSTMRLLLRAITTNDSFLTETYMDEIQKNTDDYRIQLAILNQNSPATELLNKIDSIATELKPIREKVMELARANKMEEALEVYNSGYEPLAQSLLKTLNEITDHEENNATNSYKKGNSIGNIMSITSIVFSFGILLLILYFSRLLTKMFTTPVIELENAARAMADGNLDISITYESNDEFGVLSASLKKLVGLLQFIIPDIQYILGEMATGNFAIVSKNSNSYIGSFMPILNAMRGIKANLSDTIGQIQISSLQVKAGAQNMSDGAQTLAQSATTQASTVQELTATSSELNNQITEDSKRAKAVSKNVQAVGNNAQMSQEQMSKVVSAIENISDTSKQIQMIINSIEEIASQTNLLSLNASIEAARAGEAGRGFAVVANEIGKLATESAQAATNTRNLIKVSINEIEKGNVIVQETSIFLNNVLTSITGIVQSVNDISSSTEKQAISINELGRAIEEIAASTEDNSAVAEESSATSEELFAQAENLNDLIGKFKIEKI